MYKRVFLIVLDSLGFGEAPDAELYNDKGANTIYHISENYKLTIPNLQKLGFANIINIKAVDKHSSPIGAYGLLKEVSLGKDTMTGHWELMGLHITEPFLTFTDTGFPPKLIKELEDRTGRKVIGNISASGTEIIKDLGEEHMRTGDLIVYTSADSVLQIAMHEDVIPIEEQYRISEIAREITMKPEWRVGRVITRPFVGTNKDNFKRTANRADYALSPVGKTTLDYLNETGYKTLAVGKINDIFNGQGINEFVKTKSNYDGMEKTIEIAKTKDFKGLCFVNLVDFDALYGHRRDPIGYGKAIDEFDLQLKDLLEVLKDDDLLLLTADHGNDPIHHGTDHTREYVPIIAYSPSMKGHLNLKIRESFADVGATISENFNVKQGKLGKSFLENIKEI